MVCIRMAAEMKQSENEDLEAVSFSQVMQNIDIYFNICMAS